MPYVGCVWLAGQGRRFWSTGASGQTPWALYIIPLYTIAAPKKLGRVNCSTIRSVDCSWRTYSGNIRPYDPDNDATPLTHCRGEALSDSSLLCNILELENFSNRKQEAMTGGRMTVFKSPCSLFPLYSVTLRLFYFTILTFPFCTFTSWRQKANTAASLTCQGRKSINTQGRCWYCACRLTGSCNGTEPLSVCWYCFVRVILKPSALS